MGDEEWSRLRQNYGVGRESTLKLSRRMDLDQMGGKEHWHEFVRKHISGHMELNTRLMKHKTFTEELILPVVGLS